MAVDFFKSLSSALESQFSIGENKNTTLNSQSTDSTFNSVKYGNLGEFSTQIDKSQQRQYVGEGYLRFDPLRVKQKNLEILLQEPDVTVLVKKRAFYNLAENFRLDHLDKDEKLFYKATKILFQNKAKQISALEKLSKIEKIVTETGELAAQLTPLIFSLVDEIGSAVNSTTDDFLSGPLKGFGKIQNTVNAIRKFYNYSANNNYTTWIQDVNSPFKTKIGQGTGVLELTNITNLTTTCTVATSDAGGNFSIYDPYNIMTITNSDIEKALSDATNFIFSHKIFEFAEESSSYISAANLKRLNQLRERRGASRIEFIVNPNTIFGKRIRAVISNPGVEINFTYDGNLALFSVGLAKNIVQISPEHLINSSEVGFQGLNEDEVKLFGVIVDNIYNSIELESSAKPNSYIQHAEITNYARRELRFNYLGKNVIQNMDQVHIYISSKSKIDNKISNTFKEKLSGVDILQNLGNSVSGLVDQFQSAFYPSSNANFMMEKSVIVGSDFPNFLWTMLRHQFLADSAGPHVCAGIVTNSSARNNAGIYSTEISFSNNLKFLSFGKVNFKPSLNVFNGSLYDPLTPFKMESDTVTSALNKETPILLDENKELLQTGIIKFKSGKDVGKTVTEELLLGTKEIQTDKETGLITSIGSNIIKDRNIYHCPDGFIYRWKKGIGTLVMDAESTGNTKTSAAGKPPITVEPFAGQDILNVISLLIVGVPYNYTTFMQAAKQANGYSRDIQSGEDGTASFYGSLLKDLKKSNFLWGNFIPFKNLVVDEISFQQVLNAQVFINDKNDKITKTLNEINDLSYSLLGSVRGTEDPFANNDEAKIKSDKLKSKEEELSALNTEISQQLTSVPGKSLNIIGDDVSFESDDFFNTDSVRNNSLTNPNLRKELRKKTNFLTRRLAYKVRANEDKNYFIVDDFYDKDYDFIAYNFNLSDQMSTFDSEYLSPIDKINMIKDLLDLEVYCDTQGNIRVKPPGYNKIPSSVFYRMMRLKEERGIRLFPKFFEDLMYNQITGLIKNISIIENEIRLDAALLGYNDDNSVKNLISSEKSFEFISDDKNFTISDFSEIFKQSNPELKEQIQQSDSSFLEINKAKKFEKNLFSQSNVRNIFSKRKQGDALKQAYFKNQKYPSAFTLSSTDRITSLKEKLQQQTGQKPNTDSFVRASVYGTAQAFDPLKIINDLALKFSKRQKIIKLAYHAVKNAREYSSLNNDKYTSNRLLVPNLYKNENIPEVFESMIEDETYDDYGPNSGSRYIIKDYQIKSLRIEENTPDVTAVQVNGLLNKFASNEQGIKAEFIAGVGQGNSLTTAAAVDYDLWKSYGLFHGKAIHASFLSQPVTQCAPYAAMLLSRSRKNILRASLDIVGNEFMQPGEVIYIESSDLLFYVNSVSHTFQYNGSFTTNLSLTYGHPAGEYIPTVVDFIGKIIYNNRDDSYFINYRQDNTLKEQTHLAAITLDPTQSSQNASENILNVILGGKFGALNISNIGNLINSFKEIQSLNNSIGAQNNKRATLELRVYFDGSVDSGINQNLSSGRDKVLDCLTGKIDYLTGKSPNINNLMENSIGGAGSIASIASIGAISGANGAQTNSTITLINVNAKASSFNKENEDDKNSPSQKAIDMARTLQDLKGSGNIEDMLYKYIIDCWVVFEEVNV